MTTGEELASELAFATVFPAGTFWQAFQVVSKPPHPSPPLQAAAGPRLWAPAFHLDPALPRSLFAPQRQTDLLSIASQELAPLFAGR